MIYICKITLIGLLLVSFSHVLFIYYCPFLEGDIPPWLHIFSAITLFMYQVKIMQQVEYSVVY
jgi:hypothetical protein